MEAVEEKLAKSLSAEGSVELIPYLPYLLQDLWELGSSPEDMIEIVREHIMISDSTRVLDLACGKGAVSIRMAIELGVLVKGIDIIPEFVEYARQKSGLPPIFGPVSKLVRTVFMRPFAFHLIQA